ncbi:Prosaposin [Labeo rohita]|uniref:Prosaposin n=1 Tax=Labeo rohita TaxID=84645 RepID=A0ABQ8MMM3_LABRO|nr:Prosaposin [Labeo rohita]
MQFAFVAFFLCTSTLTSGWARSVDPHLTEPRTSSIPMMNNTCTDCKKIVQMLTEMLSNQDSQHLIEKALDKFCYEHPVIPLCMDGAKTYIHLVIRHFGAFAVSTSQFNILTNQNGDICSMLGLCGSQSERKALSEFTVGLNEQGWLYAKPSRGTSQEVQLNPICNFCMFFIKTLESMLPKERTEEAIVNLLEKICDHLPSQYKDTCDNFVQKYGKELIELLLSSLPPHAICTALGLCLFPEMPMSCE